MAKTRSKGRLIFILPLPCARQESLVPSSLNPVKKSLLNRYRNQSGLETEDFPLMNVSEEQRLAASRALSRWLEENRE